MLAPHHAQLGLPGLPTSAKEFAAWDYPTAGRARRAASDKPSYATLLKRLRDMQAALPSYQPDLVGGEREISLDELRPYVAYPTNDELGGPGPVSRRYLAVRDLRIECAFPHAKVEQLAVVDLPGLGEVAVGAEAHHVDGLQNEVDVVLLVKRAMGDEAYWGEADARTLDLLDIARGFVAQRDFVFLRAQPGRHRPGPAAHAARRRQPRDQHGRAGPVLPGPGDRRGRRARTCSPGCSPRCCATSPSGCRRWTPRCWPAPGPRPWPRPTGSSVLATDLGRILGTVRASTGSAAEDLQQRAKRLRQDLAAGLQELVARLHEQAREASEDPEFVAAVEQVYAANREWITGGLGVGEQQWREEGLRRIRVDGFSAGYTGEELNRIRVEISGSFEQIDGFFAERMEQLWNAVADVLDRRARRPARAAAAAPTRCASWPTCSTAPLPRAPGCAAPCRRCSGSGWTTARSCTRGCAPSWTGWPWRWSTRKSGALTQQMTVPKSEAGVEQLYRFVVRTAEQAAYLTKKALLREAVTPALVLHAAAEQFEDTVIRSGDSELEFRRLADSYKNEIWPGVYQEIDAANARFAAVTRARDALVASLAARPGRPE